MSSATHILADREATTTNDTVDLTFSLGDIPYLNAGNYDTGTEPYSAGVISELWAVLRDSDGTPATDHGGEVTVVYVRAEQSGAPTIEYLSFGKAGASDQLGLSFGPSGELRLTGLSWLLPADAEAWDLSVGLKSTDGSDTYLVDVALVVQVRGVAEVRGYA